MWNNQATGGYARESAAALENAREILAVLNSLGWKRGAIAGVLGNFQVESGLNPWRWESDTVLSSDDPRIDSSTTNGYGLGQFTPPGKYCHDSRARAIPGFGPNYSNRTGSDYDGYAQLLFIDQYADYIPHAPYESISYAMYKSMNSDPELCADIWLVNYERGTPSALRRENALYWFEILADYEPGQPDLPPGVLPIPRGALAMIARQKGGGVHENILKRRLAGYSQNRGNRQGKRY